MSNGMRCIVACTDPADAGSSVAGVAISQARQSGARVIFYDVTHDGRMTDARPNFWAGEGEAELYNRPLDPVAIEKLGFDDLAVQVQHARDEGVDAFGWLPNESGGKGLVRYAQREHADLVLLAAGTEQTARYVDELRAAAAGGDLPGTDTIRLVDADATMVPLR